MMSQSIPVDNNSSPSRNPHKGSSEETENDSCQIVVDNSDIILKTLRNLYFEKQMCDIFLQVGSKEYGAHRLLLCAFSDVFQVMLMKPEWTEWHESRIVLQELPECEQVFHIFLEYFYTGKILITHTNVMPILALADKYIIKSLSRLCLKYMCKHVPHAAFHNQLFSWLHYVIPCGHKDIAKICQNHIKWNLEAVANTPDFSNIDPDMFISILQQNDIVVYNEMVLYNCVVRWLDLQKIKHCQSENGNEYIKKLIELVMSYIRFPMMSPRELADLLLSPLIKQNKEFFVDRMAIGMAFHSGQMDRVEAISSSERGKLLFCPRLYTSDCYSAVLLVENFSSIPSYHTSTYVFSSHMSAAECDCDKINEWVVDFYPKGVWFKKCFLIVWQGTLEVPEEIVSTVRLSLTCREMCKNNMKVKISVLIYGVQGGIEHIMEVKETICHFNAYNRVVNIDNLIPFDELNPTLLDRTKHVSPYLIGGNRDQLKLNIVITPLS